MILHNVKLKLKMCGLHTQISARWDLDRTSYNAWRLIYTQWHIRNWGWKLSLNKHGRSVSTLGGIFDSILGGWFVHHRVFSLHMLCQCSKYRLHIWGIRRAPLIHHVFERLDGTKRVESPSSYIRHSSSSSESSDFLSYKNE